MKIEIPILKLPFDQEMIDRIKGRLQTILSSGQMVLGDNNREFEQLWSGLSGLPYAISCSSGTAALEILFRYCKVATHEVIVPVNTFMATAYAAVTAGARVVFADVAAENGCLTRAAVEAASSSDTVAVAIVHIGGIITPEIAGIQELCRERGWQLIEDCAHAHGCTYAGKPAGSFGIGGAFSFFPTKVLMTGEGGVISTSDPELADCARRLRNHGKGKVRDRVCHTDSGNNWRLSELHAAVGVEILRQAKNIIAARHKIAARYDELLKGITGCEVMPMPPLLSSSYYKYLMLCRQDGFDREALKQAMRETGIALTGEVYAELCCDQPVVSEETDNYTVAGDYPGARWFADHHFCLPLYPGLTEEELCYVAENLRKYFQKEISR